MQSVAEYILALAEFAAVDKQQVIHFVTGRAGAGEIVIQVPRGRCIVLNSIEQTDIDTGLPHSIQVESAGTVQGADTDTELVAGQSAVMYFFPTGRHVFTLTLTPAAGKNAHTLFSYYEMPDSAAEHIKNSATRQLLQS
jgi:hypothetical protein